MKQQYDGTHRVKAVLQTGNNFNPFENQNFLEKKHIVGVACHLDVTKSDEGVNAIGTTSANAKTTSFLKLVDTAGKTRVTAAPLTALQPVAMQQVSPMEFSEPIDINWTESGVICADTSTITAAEVVIFTFFYRNIKK